VKGTKEIALTSRDRGVLTTVNALRDELRVATTPKKTLDVAARAAREKRIFEAIGASVERCNEWAEIYLCAYWKFGDLVKATPEGRPKKRPIDGKFSGSKHQREYARTLRAAVAESQIPEYVQSATDRLESASIAGCLEWIDPDLDERKAEARRQARLAAIEQAARGNSPLAAAIRYPVIYADPPWRYEHVKTESRAIENQYPTMALRGHLRAAARHGHDRRRAAVPVGNQPEACRSDAGARGMGLHLSHVDGLDLCGMCGGLCADPRGVCW